METHKHIHFIGLPAFLARSHSDTKNGSEAAMKELNKAFEQAKKELN